MCVLRSDLSRNQGPLETWLEPLWAFEGVAFLDLPPGGRYPPKEMPALALSPQFKSLPTSAPARTAGCGCWACGWQSLPPSAAVREQIGTPT
jgi:hypothetical protein